MSVPALTFVCDGQLYQPPFALPGTNSVVDRSSAESVMANLYTALKTHDARLFDSLYAVGEQTTTFGAGPSDRFDRMTLREKFNYGNYTIVTLEAGVNNRSGNAAVAMRLIGTNYYITDKLVNDRVYSFFKGIIQEPSFTYQASGSDNYMGREILRHAAYPFTNTFESPPLIIECYGTNYGTNLVMELDNIDESTQRLSTPEECIRAAYAATIKTNLAWYLSLISPGELDLEFKTISGRPLTIRDAVTRDFLRAARVLKLKKRIYINRVAFYGDSYAFVTTQDLSGVYDTLTVKLIGKHWLITDELNRGGDMIRNYILGSRSPDTVPFFPKVLPR